MTEVIYSAEAERRLLELPPDVALEILDAVDRFAREGVGFVRRILDGTDETRLYVAGHRVTFVRDEGAVRVLAVMAPP